MNYRLSPTNLARIEECPHGWRLEQELAPARNEAMYIGTKTHDTIEAYLKSKSVLKALRSLNESWDEHEEIKWETSSDQAYQVAKKLAMAYIAWLQYNPVDSTAIEREMQLDVKGLVLRGRCDVELETGIVDFKTIGGAKGIPNVINKPTQATWYRLLKAQGDIDLASSYTFEYHFITKDTFEVVVAPVAITREMVTNLLEVRIPAAVKLIEEESFPKQEGRYCAWCRVAATCKATSK